MIRLMLTLIFSIAPLVANAGPNDIPMEDVPPLHQVIVMQSELDNQHYVILGKDGIYQDAGNWYVIDWHRGQVKSPRLNRESFFWFDGGFDFHFESGEWLFVPSPGVARGGITERIPMGIVRAGSGREPFRRIDLKDPEFFNRLGLQEKISPKVIESLQRENQPRAQTRRAKKDSLVLITLDYTKEQDDAAEKVIKDLNKGLAIYADSMFGNISSLGIWAYSGDEEIVKFKLTRAGLNGAKSRRTTLAGRILQTPLLEPRPLFDLDSLGRLDQVAASIDYFNGTSLLKPSAERAAISDQDKVLLLSEYLRILDHSGNQISRPGYVLRQMTNNTVALNDFNTEFQQPIYDLIEQVYEQLHAVQSPLARKVLLLGGDSMVPPLRFLTRDDGTGQTYFQTWLNILEDEIQWVNTATPEQISSMRRHSHSGGVLDNFGFLNVALNDYKTSEQTAPYGLDVAKKMYPLAVFGLEDNPAYRRRMVQFIIEMDKAAEAQRQKFAPDEKIAGNQTLANVIMGFSWIAPAMKRSYKPDAALFSGALYYRQVMMIITELLDTSRLTITNNATYAALLDVAISLQKEIESEYGPLPNLGTIDLERAGMTRELIQMQRALQTRLLRTAFLDKQTGECADVLKPK